MQTIFKLKLTALIVTAGLAWLAPDQQFLADLATFQFLQAFGFAGFALLCRGGIVKPARS